MARTSMALLLALLGVALIVLGSTHGALSVEPYEFTWGDLIGIAGVGLIALAWSRRPRRV